MDMKKKLQNTALKLFSAKGYSAVSVRDITKAIGRRETCLYNYFRNKQALMDSLAADYAEQAGKAIKSLRSGLKQMSEVNRATFLHLTESLILEYLTEASLLKFTRVMMIEQSNSEEMRKMYTNYLYIIPLIYLGELFTKAKKPEGTVADSVDFLSTSFYGLMLLYFQKHMLSGNDSKAARAVFLQELTPHIQEFAALYIAS